MAEQQCLCGNKAQRTSCLQQGDDSPEKQRFLAQRLRTLYAMRQDIGQVIIATLANPAAGVALAIQKIAQKAQEELGGVAQA